MLIKDNEIKKIKNAKCFKIFPASEAEFRVFVALAAANPNKRIYEFADMGDKVREIVGAAAVLGYVSYT